MQMIDDIAERLDNLRQCKKSGLIREDVAVLLDEMLQDLIHPFSLSRERKKIKRSFLGE